MGGEIGVESAEGKGSDFWFTVILQSQPNAGSSRSHDVELEGRKVLVVDREEAHRKILSVQLETCGCSYTCLEAADDALARLRKAAEAGIPYEAALIAAKIEYGDGESLGLAIKGDPDLRRARLIYLTDSGKRGDAARIKEDGFSAYLSRPIKQSQLRDCLLLVFGGPQGGRGSEPFVTRHTIKEAALRKVRILLAEDNLVNQKVALRMLEKMGHQADVADDGKQALEQLRKTRYDLLLTDVQMPEMDGYELARAVRAEEGEGEHLPIVAMTAYAMKGDRDRCIASGMDGYVSKPVDREELAAAIQSCLNSVPQPAGSS